MKAGKLHPGMVQSLGSEQIFAHTSFKWSNLASHNAGVTVVIVGISNHPGSIRKLYSETDEGETVAKDASNINAYLVPAGDFIVTKRSVPLSDIASMNYGNYPGDGNHLTLNGEEREKLLERRPDLSDLIRPVFGAQEFLKGLSRYCLWIDDDQLDRATGDEEISRRIDAVRDTRNSSRDKSLNKLANRSHQYRDRNQAENYSILVPTVSSERREYIPTDFKSRLAVTTNQAFALYDAPLWNMSLLSSSLHLVWIKIVCGQLETRLRYSNTLGWNTFPVPKLTEKNQTDLSHCAEDIILAREAHWPATIADLYDPEKMPDNLRAAHERNDEVLERIYIGRRFKNDTERLEKLFELYTKMTTKQGAPKSRKAGAQ